MAKWPQRNPLRLLFEWRGWKSTLSPSFITFSEREPFLRGFLWWTFWSQRSQRCIGISKVCGRSFGSLQRKLAICEETLCSPLFQSLSNLPLVDQALLNLATRWRFLTPDYCKILLIWPWTKVLKVSIVKIYVKSNLDTYNILQIPFKMFFKATYHTWNRIFSSSSVLWCIVLTEVSFLMVPVFCDQVVAKLVVQSDTGKRNLEISLDIVRENCTERFYIVSSVGFQQMH